MGMFFFLFVNGLAGTLVLHTSSAFQPKCTSSTSMVLNRLFNNMIGWKKTFRLEKEQEVINQHPCFIFEATVGSKVINFKR